jgi:hypothetical protein
MPVDDNRVRLAQQHVRDDLESGFKESFSARDDDSVAFELHDADIDDPQVVVRSDDVVAFPWRYSCRHTGPFLGVPATQLDVELRGVTFVDVRDTDADAWTFYRYVDFLGALHQLGVSAIGRPALAPAEYEAWAAANAD